MALMKEDIRSLETGNAFRVEAILGGWQAPQIYYWKDRDITKRASHEKTKRMIICNTPTPAIQGVGNVL